MESEDENEFQNHDRNDSESWCRVSLRDPAWQVVIYQLTISCNRASIASVVRTVYTSAYSSEDNYLYKTGKIVLWTVIECGLGIVAGSLPMVKVLGKKRRLDKKFEELELQHAESTISLPMPARTRH